jgi:hypothetical protein
MELLIDLSNMNKAASIQVDNAIKRLLKEIELRA